MITAKILSSINIEIIDCYGIELCMNILNRNPLINAKKIDIKNINDLTNDNTDILIIAGGEPMQIRFQLKGIGAQTIRRFIFNGGGYIGICAGAVLAIPKSPSLELLQHVKVVNDNIWWGSGICGDIILNPCIKNTDEIINMDRFDSKTLFSYKNGPLMRIKKTKKKNQLTPISIASFSSPLYNANCVVSDVLLKEMNDSSAIIFGKYNKGSIIITSIHPEYGTICNDISLLEEMCMAVVKNKK